jgi:hypothetical protein
MAAHVRTQIRNAVVVLLTGLATTGSNVYKNRLIALKPNQLPALIIKTNNEAINLDEVTYPSTNERVLELEVEIVASKVSDIEDELDQILKEVEQKINTSLETSTLSGLVKSMSLTRIEPEYSDEGESKTGLMRIFFDVGYFTQASAPDVSI